MKQLILFFLTDKLASVGVYVNGVPKQLFFEGQESASKGEYWRQLGFTATYLLNAKDIVTINNDFADTIHIISKNHIITEIELIVFFLGRWN